jgi:hypothetical protein
MNKTRILTLFFGVSLALTVTVRAQNKSFPAHWGPPPKIQTMDFVPLPGGYGNGSSTLAKWIERNLEKDRQGTGGGGQSPAIFAANFETNQPGKLPEFLILDGAFEIKEDGGNKFIELPGAPLETFGLLFGPAQTNDIAVSARIQSSTQGRRYPVFGVGLNGVGGYKMLMAPAKGELELFKGEERVASAKCDWKSGAWTALRLQLRQIAAGEWRVEGKAWPAGATEPGEWMISFAEKAEPAGGRATIWGSPYSGQPIRFDDLSLRWAKEER